MNNFKYCSLCWNQNEEEVKEDLPCKRCQEDMIKGFLIIGVDFSKSDDTDNLIRTGNRWVLKRDSELIKKLFKPESIKKGAGFLDLEDAIVNGLPVQKII